MEPKISIIIPCFNASKFIEETLDSVLNQTFKEWEVIIVDDGSTDDTEVIVSKYLESNLHIYYRKRERLPKGGCTCRNIGVELARGSYIIFLDADDVLDKHCLSSRYEYVVSRANLKLCVFQMQEMDKYGNLLDKKKTNLSQDYIWSFISFDLPWQTTCPVWRTDYIREIGGFNEKLPLLQDPELHFRAIRKLVLKEDYEVLPHLKPDSYYRVFAKKRKLRIVENGLVEYFKSIVSGLNQIEKKAYRKAFYGLLFVYWRYFFSTYKYEIIKPNERWKSVRRVYKIYNNELSPKRLEYLCVLYIIGLGIFFRAFKISYMRNLTLKIFRKTYKERSIQYEKN